MDEGSWDVDKISSELSQIYTRYELAAKDYQAEFEGLLRDNPAKAIQLIEEVYRRGIKEIYTDDDGKDNSSIAISYGGGPHESIPCAIINAVGIFYPKFTREEKDNALRQVLNVLLDGQNYITVNSAYTPNVREPLLFGDIIAQRGIYWPGYKRELRLLEPYEDSFFYELREDLIDEKGLFIQEQVPSDFLLAYVLIHKDITDFAEDYVAIANPDFLERVLKATIAIKFAFVEEEEKIQEGLERLREFLPESLHDRIEPLKEEADWPKTRF